MKFVNKPARIDNGKILKTHSYLPSNAIKKTADVELVSCVLKYGAKTDVGMLAPGVGVFSPDPPAPVSLQ